MFNSHVWEIRSNTPSRKERFNRAYDVLVKFYWKEIKPITDYRHPKEAVVWAKIMQINDEWPKLTAER